MKIDTLLKNAKHKKIYPFLSKMIKYWAWSFLILFCFYTIEAKEIPSTQLIQYGIAAYQSRAHTEVVKVRSVDFITDEEDTLMVLLHFDSTGFLLMSADDAATPVLAYSVVEDLNLKNMAPATHAWLREYQKQIKEIKANHYEADGNIVEQWTEVISTNKNTRGTPVVSPLIQATWNQSQYYNDLCPEDANAPYGYGGHVPCGCVALAMAMVIHYYHYPETGQGQHGYYSDYGYHYVDYSQQTYNYAAMPYAATERSNEMAKLIYHCGISVDMDYAADGSGAYTAQVANSLVDYYKYSSDVAHKTRGYGTSSWRNTLKNNLNQGYPIVYAGSNEEGGHAFICDGYDSDNYFHFNFGWGGSGNGYYTIENVSNAVHGFSSNQQIVYNIHPPLNNYPEYCPANNIYTAASGSFEDGSAHLNYQNNTHCTYIIRPENAFSVSACLQSIDTELGVDTVSFWTGDPNNGGELIFSRSGQTANTSDWAYSRSGEIYITFNTNGNNTGKGWTMLYRSTSAVACAGRTFRQNSDTISDGEENYAPNSSCSWIIRPDNATYISLSFITFDISPEDHIIIYDGANDNTANILGTYTGSTLPSDVYSYTGVMKVSLISDNYIQKSGFTAVYTSDGTTNIAQYTDKLSDFYFAPNPATNYINISFPHYVENSVIQILDLSGRCVKKMKIENTHCMLSTATLSDGMYFIQWTNGEEVISKKLIIKN